MSLVILGNSRRRKAELDVEERETPLTLDAYMILCYNCSDNCSFSCPFEYRGIVPSDSNFDFEKKIDHSQGSHIR
jgi:hypothetical protein